MTWEETIQEIRRQPTFKSLVKEAYLGEDLEDNIQRFQKSEEFRATLKEISKFDPSKTKVRILDLGAGNGISTISFAMKGYHVVALEPDPSNTIGAGAIRIAAQIFEVEDKVTVEEAWGEKLPFDDNHFDIVYGRQVMHHAHELNQFVAEASRVLKKGGLFMTTRDHVIKDDQDKEAFLNRHPLHKFYGGENAFTLEEYKRAIQQAGLTIQRSLNAKESVINYDPWGKSKVKEKLGVLGNLPLLPSVAMSFVKYRLNRIPGRLHTFVASK